MLTAVLISIFKRDLEKLKKEIGLYKKESTIWLTGKEVPNSAGNLCLHLIGNLNTYIGKELGGTNYVRNRDLEFSQKDIVSGELIEKVEATANTVANALYKLKQEDLEKDYPVMVFENNMSTEYFLVHLTAHLAYHLGQINYHRRFFDTD
ncbi:MAG: DUF1572 family protein [Rhizobacter sp.]|nr:DUF1572 family protein [Ferruginibacter sp.]